jgi:hypothetical protein
MAARKNTTQSAETRAKISATMKARGIKPVVNPFPPTRPVRGTYARRLFEKIRNECGSLAAHVELKRGV